jgi:hypothetical protein
VDCDSLAVSPNVSFTLSLAVSHTVSFTVSHCVSLTLSLAVSPTVSLTVSHCVSLHQVLPNAEWARRGPGDKKSRFRGGASAAMGGGMTPGPGGLCFDFTQVRGRFGVISG